MINVYPTKGLDVWFHCNGHGIFSFSVSETLQSSKFPPQNGSVCRAGFRWFALSGNVVILSRHYVCLGLLALRCTISNFRGTRATFSSNAEDLLLVANVLLAVVFPRKRRNRGGGFCSICSQECPSSSDSKVRPGGNIVHGQTNWLNRYLQPRGEVPLRLISLLGQFSCCEWFNMEIVVVNILTELGFFLFL